MAHKCNIYIETSIKWNQVDNGVVGIVVCDEKNRTKSIFGVVKKCSQSAAVLFGLKKILSYLDDYDHVILHLSCSHVANAFCNHWLDSWKTNEFRSIRGKEIQNRDVWIDVSSSLEGKTVDVVLNQFNEYRRWLMSECQKRASYGRTNHSKGKSRN